MTVELMSTGVFFLSVSKFLTSFDCDLKNSIEMKLKHEKSFYFSVILPWCDL